MRRVLIIASDFIPSSLPPATRVRFFVKHLAELGWEPIVLTVDPKHYEAAVDEENQNLLPPSLRVIRTGAFSTRWTRKLGVGDIGIRSLWHHWRAIRRLSQERKIDLIFIPVPSSVPMILGRLANRRFGIPYIIDYIDPWVTESYWRLPKAQRPPKWRAAYWLARIVEPFALKKVSHITGVSEGTTDSVINSYSWLSREQGTEIPYGAEAADFEYVQQNPRRNSIFDSNDGLVHLSYVGAITPAMYPTVRALFAAVHQGLEHSAEMFARVRLHFIGTSYAPDDDAARSVLALAKEAHIETLATEHPGRIPYLESLQVMIDSHALLLIGSDEEHYTASKVFPYILARRPLLAILHEQSNATTILNETNACRPITFNSQRGPAETVGDISARLEEIVDSPSEDPTDTRWDVFERYTTKAMTARLAHVLDNTVENSRQDSQVKGSDARKTTSQNPKPVRILIPFSTVSLYGMERGVIETFDLLRPEVEPHFLLSYSTLRLGLPVLAEIRRRGLRHSFFSDTNGWPRIGRPRSLREGWRMMIAMLRGNRDVFMAALGKDLIYIPSINYFYFAICVAIFHRLRRRRIIYHFHDLIATPSRALRLTAIFVTDFVHNTQFGRAEVARASPYVEKKRNWVIPLMVCSPPSTARDGDQRADFEAKRNILFVGQVARHKGIDLLLDAFEELTKSSKDLVLNIVGGCDDPLLQQQVEEKTSGNGYVKWWGYQEDVGQFLRAAYLYVHPSPPSRFHESFGIGLVEAMSLGIPSVCFRSGAFQEIMIHEETGLICEDEKPQSLAKSIDRLLRDAALREHCSQKARKRYQENYSTAQIKSCWLKALGIVFFRLQ